MHWSYFFLALTHRYNFSVTQERVKLLSFFLLGLKCCWNWLNLADTPTEEKYSGLIKLQWKLVLSNLTVYQVDSVLNSFDKGKLIWYVWIKHCYWCMFSIWINTWNAEVRKYKNIFEFSIISQHWVRVGIWNHSSWKTRTPLSYIVKIMAADALVMQGTRASVAMVLTLLSHFSFSTKRAVPVEWLFWFSKMDT